MNKTTKVDSSDKARRRYLSALQKMADNNYSPLAYSEAVKKWLSKPKFWEGNVARHVLPKVFEKVPEINGRSWLFNFTFVKIRNKKQMGMLLRVNRLGTVGKNWRVEPTGEKLEELFYLDMQNQMGVQILVDRMIKVISGGTDYDTVVPNYDEGTITQPYHQHIYENVAIRKNVDDVWVADPVPERVVENRFPTGITDWYFTYTEDEVIKDRNYKVMMKFGRKNKPWNMVVYHVNNIANSKVIGKVLIHTLYFNLIESYDEYVAEVLKERLLEKAKNPQNKLEKAVVIKKGSKGIGKRSALQAEKDFY